MPKAKGPDPVAEELTEHIGKHAVFVARMEEELSGLKQALEEHKQQNSEGFKRFDEFAEKLNNSEANIRKAAEEDLAGARNELMALMEVRRAEQASLREELRELREERVARLQESLDATSDETQAALSDVKAMIAEAKGAAGSSLQVLKDELSAIADAQAASEAEALEAVRVDVTANREVHERADVELRALTEAVDKDLQHKHQTTEKALLDLASAFEDQLVRMREEMRLELRGQLFKQVQEEIDNGFNRILERTAQQIRYIERTVEHHALVVNKTQWTVDNMYTRAISWKVPGFKKKAYALVKTEDSFLVSPGFSVCSLPDMVLEVLIKSSDETVVPLPGAVVVPVPGACSLKLWGPRGMHAVFRLIVGDGASAVSRRFECTFPEDGILDDAGRSSFVAHNICQQNACYDRDTDTATFGFEILEFRMPGSCCISNAPRYVPLHVLQLDEEQLAEGPPSLPPPSAHPDVAAAAPEPGNQVPLDEEAAAELAAAEEERRIAEEAAAKYAADQAEIDEQLEDIRCGDVEGIGDIGATRFATSELVIAERLQKEHQALRNKAVRKIEWRLEGISRILEMCTIGQAIDSPLFSAAGIQGLQLHFYPRGVGGDSGAPGAWCALYVSGPSKTTLKGTLHVGGASKPIEHRFQRRGDAGGRGRFCNLENAVSCEDSVILALEITHLDVELPDVATTLCLREVRGGAAAATGGGDNRGAPGSVAASPPLAGTKGLLRMRKEDTAKTEECMRSVSLPSLNTREKQRPLAKLIPQR